MMSTSFIKTFLVTTLAMCAFALASLPDTSSLSHSLPLVHCSGSEEKTLIHCDAKRGKGFTQN
ncbi:hypothetical protein BJ085DRAFT_39040 [Dimargaris cristalligena]|uniref:Uncharacterized protein n=1 Tax=Dimargaris cristalligena TaxID=215637 RepID=A0A4P9ZJE8_9FUNG|nr:hypothetical protein BJ085DRAFT_39040 [Dimargaris cristalligena]|eukprot:RKP33337.1 hypothetical protein BJ085DRAFT_39040 [Dimargaris cristalligena]